MKPIGILYATREGHTERIAGEIGDSLYARGFDNEIRNLRTDGCAIRPDDYSAVILAASVHAGKHEPEMVRFVKDNLRALESMPAAFLSVTLSQAGVEIPGSTPEQRALCAAGVQQVLAKFYADTGWRPRHVMPVAGALLYGKYNFLVRFIMKRIARKSGGSIDTSRDHEYTDWTALDRFVTNFAKEFSAPPPEPRRPARSARNR